MSIDFSVFAACNFLQAELPSDRCTLVVSESFPKESGGETGWVAGLGEGFWQLGSLRRPQISAVGKGWLHSSSSFISWLPPRTCSSPLTEQILSSPQEAWLHTFHQHPECLMKPWALPVLSLLHSHPQLYLVQFYSLRSQHCPWVDRPSSCKEEPTLCLNGLGDSGRTRHALALWRQ